MSKPNEFGLHLQEIRKKSRTPGQNYPLSQAHLANLIAEKLGTAVSPVPQTVSNWERGVSQPKSKDRDMLMALLAVLVECGGFKSLEEADHLLFAGGYASLSEDEYKEVFHRLKGVKGDDRQNRSTGNHIPTPFHFSFGPIDTPLVIIDGNGERNYTPDTIFCHHDPTPLAIPLEIAKIKERIAIREMEKREKGQNYMWNGLTYGLKKYTRGRTIGDENPELNLWFFDSDWFTHVATSQSLDSEMIHDPIEGNSVTLREKYFTNTDWSSPSLQPYPLFANTFGVVICLISSDSKLIIIRRSQEVSSLKGVYNIAINEGVQRNVDRSAYDKAPDLYRTVMRGASEELGLELNRSDIIFLNFCVDIRNGDWGMIGFARTLHTVEEIAQNRRLGAIDKWEGMGFFAIDFDPITVVNFVNDHRNWSPGALASIYYTLVHEFKQKIVNQTISRHMY